LIIAGAVLYIAATMISHQFWPDQPKEEDYESYDIIKYFTTSINWYSFNTIIIGVPVILLILSEVNPRLEVGDEDGTYWYLLLVLAIVHFVQFLFIKQLMKVRSLDEPPPFQDVGEDDDNFKKVEESNSHRVEKRFNYDYWWFWIISGVVEVVVLTLFFMTDGNELYFIFWIPTDAILFTCMFIYYILSMMVDKKKVEMSKSFKIRSILVLKVTLLI
jgi:hypothetical protein